MDDKKRFEMIYNEIIRLNSLSNEECDEILKSLNDILIFNQTHLIEINRDLKYEYKFGNYIHSLLFPKRNELI
jgi:predicted DNA-binding helix-hairpin-helix protein